MWVHLSFLKASCGPATIFTISTYRSTYYRETVSFWTQYLLSFIHFFLVFLCNNFLFWTVFLILCYLCAFELWLSTFRTELTAFCCVKCSSMLFIATFSWLNQTSHFVIMMFRSLFSPCKCHFIFHVPLGCHFADDEWFLDFWTFPRNTDQSHPK